MNQTGKKLELSPENAIVFAGYGLLFSYYTEHDKFIPLPGVKELVSKLAERNVKIGCLSNTGHNSSTEFASRLEESGIIIPKENVVTAADAALAHIKTRWGSNLRKLRVLFLGRKKGGLYELLQQENVTFVNDPNERAELALIGSDPKYYVEKGKQMNEEIRKNAENVAKAVLAGAYPLCTSRDKVIMTTNGNMLGPGIVVNEAEQNLASAGSTIRFNCAGKPSADIFKLIMKRLGTEPHQTLIIGDQIDMDIVGANNSLCKSILILSDKEQVPELKKCMNDNKTDCLPDFVFQSAEELARSI